MGLNWGLKGVQRGLMGLNGVELFASSNVSWRTYLIPEWILVNFEPIESRITCIGDSHESPEHQPRNLGGIPGNSAKGFW